MIFIVRTKCSYPAHRSRATEHWNGQILEREKGLQLNELEGERPGSGPGNLKLVFNPLNHLLFLGLAFPYDPLNLFPLFVFLSPLPHTIGFGVEDDDAVEYDEVGSANRWWVDIILLAIEPHHCIIAIFFTIFSLLSSDSSSPKTLSPYFAGRER